MKMCSKLIKKNSVLGVFLFFFSNDRFEILSPLNSHRCSVNKIDPRTNPNLYGGEGSEPIKTL